jgi:hypothetical protein
MRLTAFSDYTIRMLIYLALRRDVLCTKRKDKPGKAALFDPASG